MRRRITVRGFGRHAGSPRNHGDFNNLEMDVPFWKEEFWDPRMQAEIVESNFFVLTRTSLPTSASRVEDWPS